MPREVSAGFHSPILKKSPSGIPLKKVPGAGYIPTL